MNEKLMIYLDGIFSRYEDIHAVKELKEELYVDLQEKLNDFKNQGYDDETAYRMAINSIGDIGEIIESIGHKTRELLQMTGMDFSHSDLRKSDFKWISAQTANFNGSDLREADFYGSDLTDSSFKYCDLRRAKFCSTDLTKTNFDGSDLSDVRFENQTLNGTIFDNTELSGASFRNAIFKNVSFKWAEAKKAIFDSATMDNLTYFALKRNNADLTNVTVI